MYELKKIKQEGGKTQKPHHKGREMEGKGGEEERKRYGAGDGRYSGPSPA